MCNRFPSVTRSVAGLTAVLLTGVHSMDGIALTAAKPVVVDRSLILVQATPDPPAATEDEPGADRGGAPFEDLNAALAAARAKLEQLTGAAELATMASDLRNELEAAREENARLADELESARAALEAARQDLDRAESSLAEKDQAIDRLEAETEERAQAVARSSDETADLRRRLAASQERLAEAERAQRDAEARVAGMREELSAALAEAAQLREQNDTLQSRLAEAGAATTRVEGERDAARGEAAALREDKATLEAHLEEAEAEVARLKRRAAGMEEQLSELQNAADSAADTARANLTAMEDKIALLNAALAEVQPAAAPAGEAPDSPASTVDDGAHPARADGGAQVNGGAPATDGATPVPPAASAASAREQLAALQTLIEKPPASQPPREATLEDLKAGDRSASTPQVLARLTAALPFEERMQAQGLLTDLEAETTNRGLLVSIPGEVLFALNSDSIEDTAHDHLAKVAEVVGLYGDRNVLITGHTDAMGDPQYNETLSKRRADLVRRFFVENFDIERERLFTRGLGETRPIASNATLAGRQANRRIEVLILD